MQNEYLASAHHVFRNDYGILIWEREVREECSLTHEETVELCKETLLSNSMNLGVCRGRDGAHPGALKLSLFAGHKRTRNAADDSGVEFVRVGIVSAPQNIEDLLISLSTQGFRFGSCECSASAEYSEQFMCKKAPREMVSRSF